MTLPSPPDNWNIKRLNTERTEAVAAFGFTDRQARFLVEVMIHSGVFVERQYCTFAGIVHGQKTHDFLRKLVERGFARPVQVGPLHRGRLFHIGYKPLYAAIGQADNRHRKAMPLARMIERLMVLDAVLADRTFTWLGTEQDKRVYFMKQLRGRLELHEFPHRTYTSGTRQTVRRFPDKLPIGIEPGCIDHVFLYLITSRSRSTSACFCGGTPSCSERSPDGRSGCPQGITLRMAATACGARHRTKTLGHRSHAHEVPSGGRSSRVAR